MTSTLNINGTLVPADIGETLVDAALGGKILIPHDCASGQCETCRVTVAFGAVDGAGTDYGNTVLACQARVSGDATITYDAVDPPETVSGVVSEISALNDDVAEVVVKVTDGYRHRPGQYAHVKFAGFPAREYSYSARMGDEDRADEAVFQIKRYGRGRVSPALGKSIRTGHRVSMHGPFGNAFLREQSAEPIVLVSSGTGFAPIWSLAKAVTRSNRRRPMTMVVGSRVQAGLYMAPAMDWLRDHQQTGIKLVSSEAASRTVAQGRPDAHLGDLQRESHVHVAGSPRLVEAVRARALVAQAQCFADPFTPSTQKRSFGDFVAPLFNRRRA